MQNSLPMTLLTRKTYLVILVTILLYLGLSIGSALSKRPWSDEGWFAAPAYNLLVNGSMGTLVVEPNLWLPGINQHTYWVMPLHLVTQTAWYKLFGFSLFSMRTLSTFWGLVALASWFVIIRYLWGNLHAALLAVVLLAIDYNFIMGASFGRMDLMCAALGFAGLAAYLWLREKHLQMAILVSHSLVVASGMTHFNGIMPLISLLFLTYYYDRSRIKWHYLLIAAIPYLIGATGWGLYIMQSPSDFVAQFKGNATDNNRLAAIASPWNGLVREITLRYLQGYGLGTRSAGRSPLTMLKGFILIAYVIGLVGCILTRSIRQHRGGRALLVILTIYFIILTVLDSQKQTWYLIHITPIYVALLALWVRWCWENLVMPRWVIVLGVCGLLALQLAGVVQRIAIRDYQNGHVPVVKFLKSNMEQNALIFGCADLGFDLGFDGRLIDDRYLGFYTGKRPDFIVVEGAYEDAFLGSKNDRPQIYQHITTLMREEYHQVYNQGQYQIYANNGKYAANLPMK